MEGWRVARRATRRPEMQWNGLERNALSDKQLKVRCPRSGDWTFYMTGAELQRSACHTKTLDGRMWQM